MHLFAPTWFRVVVRDGGNDVLCVEEADRRPLRDHTPLPRLPLLGGRHRTFGRKQGALPPGGMAFDGES